MAVIC